MIRINSWSGPRNVSTALMYSFGQRADTTVFDEPLYGHYLRVTGRDHPGRDAVLASQDPDGEAVVADLILGEHLTPIVFFKQMAHHLVELDRGFLGRCRNLLLVREPRAMLASLAVHLPDATLADTGLENQVALLGSVLTAGETPVVVAAGALLDDPRAVLTRLCARLGISFDEAMLSWPAGPKAVDGVWAEHWYARVHETTGFVAGGATDRRLPARLEPVLAEALPLYERLCRFAI